MCFHTTYLFSLCGHTSISLNPVRHTKPCKKAFTTPETADLKRHGSGTPTSVHAPASSFPSPQELKFAKRLHDSVPASPVTAIASTSRDRDGTDIIDAYGASQVTAAPVRGRYKSDFEQLMVPPPCPNLARHPLHTYILPLLCVSCQHARLQNIAHFEAQTIRESVEREQAFGYNKNGVVDPERKKIVRNSGARRKGELIPLICVEEARIENENIPAVEDVQQPETGAGEVVEQDEESRKLVAEMEQMNAQIQATSIGSAVSETADKDVNADAEKGDSKSGQAPTTGKATTTSSSWSWWGRSTANASPKPASPAPEKPQQDSKHKKRASIFSMGTPQPASPRVDVSRDGFGRNLKGMNRIMGWDGGGT